MFGDRCNETQQCGFQGSVCDPSKKSCQCRGDLLATNHYDLCGEGKTIEPGVELDPVLF